MRSVLFLALAGAAMAAPDRCETYDQDSNGKLTMSCRQMRTGIPSCDLTTTAAPDPYPKWNYIPGAFGRDWAAAGMRYYGVPAVDQLVFLCLLIMALKITKPWASSNAAGGAKCLRLMEFLMYFFMMWVGKILVFSQAQQTGIFLEYLPFIGLYGLVKESAPISFAYALILSYMFLEGVFYTTITTLTNSALPYTSIGEQEENFPGRTVLQQLTFTENNQCGNIGDSSFFGCYCLEIDNPDLTVAGETGFRVQPRYWFQWDRWTGALSLFVIFYMFAAAISIVLHFARVSNTYTRTQ